MSLEIIANAWRAFKKALKSLVDDYLYYSQTEYPSWNHYTPNKEYIWWSEEVSEETEKSRDSSLSLIGKIHRDAKKILEADE